LVSRRSSFNQQIQFELASDALPFVLEGDLPLAGLWINCPGLTQNEQLLIS
jgi:hypothetical protein